MNEHVKVTILWTAIAILSDGTEVLQSNRAQVAAQVQRAAQARESFMRDKYSVGAIDTTCEVVA